MMLSERKRTQCPTLMFGYKTVPISSNLSQGPCFNLLTKELLVQGEDEDSVGGEVPRGAVSSAARPLRQGTPSHKHCLHASCIRTPSAKHCHHAISCIRTPSAKHYHRAGCIRTSSAKHCHHAISCIRTPSAKHCHRAGCIQTPSAKHCHRAGCIRTSSAKHWHHAISYIRTPSVKHCHHAGCIWTPSAKHCHRAGCIRTPSTKHGVSEVNNRTTTPTWYVNTVSAKSATTWTHDSIGEDYADNVLV